MTKTKIIIAGVGGQGVVFLSRLFAEVARLSGDPLISYESHGMAMRGGSVSSHLKIGGFQSPLIANGEGNILMLLTADELPATLHLLQPHGRLFINTETTAAALDKYQPATIPATSIALEHDLPRAVNLLVTGFAAAHPGFPYDITGFRSALETIPVSKKIKAANIAALELGYNYYQNTET